MLVTAGYRWTCPSRLHLAARGLGCVAEAYHNPAAVWWGTLAASAVIRDQLVIVKPVLGLPGQQRRRQDHQLGRSVARSAMWSAITWLLLTARVRYWS